MAKEKKASAKWEKTFIFNNFICYFFYFYNHLIDYKIVSRK